MREFADAIKERVSCREFAEFMGLEVNRAGFAVCPFHGDTDASLKIYKDGRGWCCFGCHKGGDVINMASLYYKLPFAETVRRLDADFALHLPLESPQTAPERLLMAVQAASRRSTRLKEKRLREAVERDYWRAYEKWLDSGRRIEQYAPLTKDEDWSDAFVAAVMERDSFREELELAEERRLALYASS